MRILWNLQMHDADLKGITIKQFHTKNSNSFSFLKKWQLRLQQYLSSRSDISWT